MSDDVMARLMAVEALPRGERLARYIDQPSDLKPGFNALWEHLFDASRVLNALDNVFAIIGQNPARRVSLRTHSERWRAYAAPLRKCRKERLQWRTHAMEFAEYVAAQGTVGDGNLDSMCRSDVTDAMEFLNSHGKVIIDETLSDRWVRGRWVR